MLDGDNIRCGLNKDLGLSPTDRIENVRRIAEVAKILVDAGILVLAAFITPYQESRQFVRQLMVKWPYYECYVRCPLSICEQRDPKGLYKKARTGIITDMTGISAPYEEPRKPDLIVSTDSTSLNESVELMVRFLCERDLISPPSYPKAAMGQR